MAAPKSAIDCMKLYIFGNGNISFRDFISYYENPLRNLLEQAETHFILCDFRGVDTLTMEVLKSETKKTSIYHIGEKPRYLPDCFRTKVSQWELVGGFTSDRERDSAAIQSCTHFLATDFNSDERRKSGTERNIEKCLALGKIRIR